MMFEITCDNVDDALLCGEKATTVIVMEQARSDVSPWFVTAYCDEHAREAVEEAESFMPGECIIIALDNEEASASKVLAIREPDWKQRPCPQCHAMPGYSCKEGEDYIESTHLVRIVGEEGAA